MPFSDILFSKAESLIKIGRVRVVQATDHLDLPLHLNPQHIPWEEENLNWTDRKVFLRSLFKVSWPTTSRAILLQTIASLLSFATPFLVHAFITRLQAGTFTQQELIELAFLTLGFGLCGGGQGIIIQHYFFRTLQFNQIATNIVNKKIFSHALKLSSGAKNKFPVGDVVNFMSADSDAIADSSITVIDLTNAAVLLIGCTASLFYFLGWSAAVALLVMVLLIPITNKLSKSFMHLEDQMMAFRDQRMTLMTQVMNAIRVVKYFVWEKSVLSEVNLVRRKEINSRYQLAKAEVFWGLIYTSITSIVLFAALLTHVLRGFQIDLALIFTCISIFAIMEDHFGGLSKFISRFINILVSSDRIIKFLNSDQVKPTNNFFPKQKNLVDFKAVGFYYLDQKPLFQNLNLSVLQGQSVAIVGPVGSGKSTLLQLLLSEEQSIAGQIHFQRSFKKAYVPQEAFIVNASLRENIIFGSGEENPEKMQHVLQVSALEYDLFA